MSLPDIPNEKASNFGARVRETVQTMMGLRGDKLDRVLTLRDVIESGLFTLRKGATVGTGAAPLEPGPNLPQPEVFEPDLTPPPQPDGFAVSAAISHVFIEHNPPTYTQGHGHLRTRVYGAIVTPALPAPVFSDAVEITQFSGTIHAHPSNPATTWRLWIKWESNDGVLSATPAGGTNGLLAVTGQDVSSMVSAMTGTGNPFTILTAPTVIGGVTFPAGTYSTQAFVLDAQITNAKIANLAVDDAKIANLSASKLTAGSIAVGQFIQSTSYVAGSSGWRINGDGTAEFSGVVARGTVFASAGLIGGSTIGSTYIRSNTYVLNESGWNFNSDGTGQVGGIAFLTNAMQSSNYVAGSAGWKLGRDGSLEMNTGTFRGAVSGSQFTTGAITGYAWPPAGVTFGTYLGPSGLLIGNANNGATSKYFQVEASGNIYAPGFSVVNGVLTINQANVIDTLQLAGNSVSVSNAVTGAGTAVSTTLFAKPGSTFTIVAIAYFSTSNETLSTNSSMTVTIDGDSASGTVGIVSRAFDDSQLAYSRYGGVMMHLRSVSGGTSGRTVTISASAPAEWTITKRLVCFGFYK